jgi:hypothetical protein
MCQEAQVSAKDKVLEFGRVDDASETVPRSIRLKSSGPTFSVTDSVYQKTCVT